VRLAIVFALALLTFGPPTNADAQQRLGGDRVRLENEIRRRFAQLVRQRVGLTDEQIRQVAPMTQRYEQQRRQLLVEERETRTSLRAMMRDEGTADSAQVSRRLQQLIDIQKRRVQLVEAEQRDLATVMTPIQRAKFMALQEQVRRRLEQMRQQQALR
jgi:Spy/CpxP family protein refolding chaperone